MRSVLSVATTCAADALLVAVDATVLSPLSEKVTVWLGKLVRVLFGAGEAVGPALDAVFTLKVDDEEPEDFTVSREEVIVGLAVDESAPSARVRDSTVPLWDLDDGFSTIPLDLEVALSAMVPFEVLLEIGM